MNYISSRRSCFHNLSHCSIFRGRMRFVRWDWPPCRWAQKCTTNMVGLHRFTLKFGDSVFGLLWLWFFQQSLPLTWTFVNCVSHVFRNVCMVSSPQRRICWTAKKETQNYQNHSKQIATLISEKVMKNTCHSVQLCSLHLFYSWHNGLRMLSRDWLNCLISWPLSRTAERGNGFWYHLSMLSVLSSSTINLTEERCGLDHLDHLEAWKVGEDVEIPQANSQ